jgi:2'-5' RNA ligase
MAEADVKTIRCFVGAFVAAESAERLAAGLRIPPGLRRIDQSTWHVTLKFLGSIDVHRIPEVLDAVDELHGRPVEAAACALVGLPRASYARVVAVELEEPFWLADWAGRLAERFGPEGRPFRPHVSVARSRRPIRFPRVEWLEPLRIRLEGPALYRSHLDGQGARYERVERDGVEPDWEAQLAVMRTSRSGGESAT